MLPFRFNRWWLATVKTAELAKAVMSLKRIVNLGVDKEADSRYLHFNDPTLALFLEEGDEEEKRSLRALSPFLPPLLNPLPFLSFLFPFLPSIFIHRPFLGTRVLRKTAVKFATTSFQVVTLNVVAKESCFAITVYVCKVATLLADPSYPSPSGLSKAKIANIEGRGQGA